VRPEWVRPGRREQVHDEQMNPGPEELDRLPHERFNRVAAVFIARGDDLDDGHLHPVRVVHINPFDISCVLIEIRFGATARRQSFRASLMRIVHRW
jgi:hypothetical protein